MAPTRSVPDSRMAGEVMPLTATIGVLSPPLMLSIRLAEPRAHLACRRGYPCFPLPQGGRPPPLDHVRATNGEQPGAEGPGDQVAEFEDLDTGQGRREGS